MPVSGSVLGIMEGFPLEPIEGRQVHNIADLFADLRKMVNNPEYSDVVFVCKDGLHVHALRLLISARCPVLRSLLKTNEKEVALPDISSSALLSIFEFLYTGTMVEHAPMSAWKAYEMISAARYFQLQQGEDIVRNFLVNSTGEISGDLTKAAQRLSVALEFATLSGTVDAIPLSLVKILNSGDLESIHLQSLSENAFRYFLKKTQSTTESGTLSFGEYLRFRQIILWCVTQVCPVEAQEIVDLFLPDARSAALLLSDHEKFELSRPRDDSNREHTYLKSLLLRRSDSASLLDSWLGEVDFRRMHAELLATVVEPLKIVSPSELVAAFQSQTLHKVTALTTNPAQYQWEHGSSYGTAGNGSVLAKIKPDVGLARFPVPISRPYGIYEWDIIIEELCNGFCEIGFYSQDGIHDGKPNFNGVTVADQPNGWAMRHEMVGTRINQRGNSPGWVSFNVNDFAYVNGRVRVHLDMFDRCCSFSVKGESTVAWQNLPEGVYFPAVSLGTETEGRVRIELVKGFDMF